MYRSLLSIITAAAVIVPAVTGLGQEQVISFADADGAFQLAGGDSTAAPQILVSDNDYWGVVRAAGDLARDFGRVTGTNFTLSNGQTGASPASYEYHPAAANFTVVCFSSLNSDLQ